MPDRLDHRLTALNALNAIKPGTSQTDAQIIVGIAQTHATLHLAEMVEKGLAGGLSTDPSA